jgi:hypothetical protein
LRGILSQALEGFFSVLDAYALSDLISHSHGRRLAQYLHIEPAKSKRA